MTVPEPVEPVWLLYRFYDKGRANKLYIGQTRQDAIARWAQHLRDQWWGYKIRHMDADVQEFDSLEAAMEAEERAIKSEWPLHNDKHNHANPYRIAGPPPGFVRPARTRPIVQTRRSADRLRSRRRPAAVRRRQWPTPGEEIGAYAAIWAVGAAGMSAEFWRWGRQLSLQVGCEYGVGAATGVLLVGLWLTRRTRRRRR